MNLCVYAAHGPTRVTHSVSIGQYIGESMNPDGMVALLNYREDGVTRAWSLICCTAQPNTYPAYFTFWKDGLKQIKL